MTEVVQRVTNGKDAAGTEIDKELSLVHLAAVGPERAPERYEPDRHPLMHRTGTVDCGIVLSFDKKLLLDSSEIVLKSGDVVMQRDTLHASTARTARLSFE